MSKDLKSIQEIDEYISGQLDAGHRNEFEKKLAEDSEVQEDLDATKKVIEGIQGYAFRQMLSDLQKKLFP
jgi:anti-sigma factor RsiW